MFKPKIFRTTLVLTALTVYMVAAGQPTPGAAAASILETTSSSSVEANSLPGVRFVHIATANNTSFHVTSIDHPLLNGNPNAIFLVTQNWNPGGVGGTYNNHAIGVYYTSTKWAIFNQDFAAMPVGAAFNIFVPDAGSNVFVHTATSGAGGNIGCSSSHCTYLNHPLLNNNPNAIFLVTQNWNPGGVGGTYNNHAIGVWYDSAQNKWVVFNQDFAAMPANASFNVVVANPTSTAFIHKATSGAGGNISANVTYIDHPLLNGNPNAIVLATQNLTPNGVYNNRKIGVFYSNSSKKWAIFNQGGNTETMPANASFNVLVPDARTDVFVQKRSASDASYATLIDHPLLNNNPNAIFLVTPNWNPAGVGGTYNNHAINVWYNPFANKWLIRNQDSVNMLLDASFNVLIPPPGANVFVHKATDDSISGHTSTIDYPLLNNKPNAVFLVTQNYNPGGGAGGMFNNHPIGVWYDGSKWRIFNQDLVDMPVGASFNVMVLNDLTALPWAKAAFVHTATTGGNIIGNWTALNHPLSNGTPLAFVFATDNYNPGGVGGTYNNHHTGVWYTGGSTSILLPNRWAIFNQDGSAMPNNAGFNVLVIARQVFIPMAVK